jgi:ribose transport system substrate-binding protein
MKRSLKILLIVLVSGLCLGFIGYSYNLSEIQIRLVNGSGSNKNDGEPLKYHFMMIAQDMGGDFWQSVKAGMQDAAEKYGAAIEYNGSMIQDENEEIDYLKIAIASRVNGIIVYVTDEAKFTPLINKAVSMGIHVVTIESDDKDSLRNTYVGPNSYMVGYNEGGLIAEASGKDSANVAVIVGGNFAGNNDSQDSMLRGFADSIHDYHNITLQTVQVTNSGYFSAETIIRNILSNYPKVNAVVCTGADDTLEVVQVLIDLNKESGITVIGYSNSQQIRDYIKKNCIYGSVYENPKETGYQSIESLVKSLGGEKAPSYIDTGVYTITRSNLVSYYPAGS